MTTISTPAKKKKKKMSEAHPENECLPRPAPPGGVLVAPRRAMSSSRRAGPEARLFPTADAEDARESTTTRLRRVSLRPKRGVLRVRDSEDDDDEYECGARVVPPLVHRRRRRGLALPLLSLCCFVGSLAVPTTTTTTAHSKEEAQEPRYNVMMHEEHCTTIVVGKAATGEGGPLTSHTNDCAACDFRLSKVPRRNVEDDALRPVYRYRAEYPRFLGDGKGTTYESAEPFSSAWRKNRGDFAPIGFIRDAPAESLPRGAATLTESPDRQTFAYVDGAYGMMNEMGLAIGESTCPAELVAKPIGEEGGTALIDARELTLIAMERCATAACAVGIMGETAETYGYYGADSSHVEAGEALTIVDADDAWVFHVCADDTGFSAVWAARRVPSDHVAVVANQFTIGDVPGASSFEDGFVFSSNIRAVAARAGLWPNGAPLHFAKTFGQPRGLRLAPYATLRTWRIFAFALSSGSSAAAAAAESTHTLFALPDDILESQFSLPPPDKIGDEYAYPFSVAVPPNGKFPASSVRSALRDHFEGTKFDMTLGAASGPFGDPSRFDAAGNLDIFPNDGVTSMQATRDGALSRALSIFRCSYAFVAQPRKDALKDPPMAWVAQYAPHASSFLPVFPTAPTLPKPLTTGSLHTVDFESHYWSHAVVGNWAARFYVVAHPIVAAEYDLVEKETFDAVNDARAAAALDDSSDNIDAHDNASRAEFLGAVADRVARRDVDRSWALFWRLAAQVKDGQRLVDLTAEKLAPQRLFYRKSWLDRVGFFFGSPQRAREWPLASSYYYLRFDAAKKKTQRWSSSSSLASWWASFSEALTSLWDDAGAFWRNVEPPLQLAAAFLAGVVLSACCSSCCCSSTARRRH